MRPLLALATAIVGLAALASPALAQDDPAQESPFGGELPPPLERPESRTAPPPGFAISAADAIRAAAATDAVREELAESPERAAAGAHPRRSLAGQLCRRRHRWSRSRSSTAPPAQVDEAWRDFQVATPLARGYEGAIAQKVNAPYVWLPLCLLFLAPFFDPRRPLRLVHLDLLVLLALGVSLFYFNRAEITASVLLTYPVLGYFLIRALVAGFWPRARAGPVVPLVGVRWLAIGVIALAAGRIALNLADSHVIDIGVAGVIGADRIADGAAALRGRLLPRPRPQGRRLRPRSTTSPTCRSSSSSAGMASGTPTCPPRTRPRSPSTCSASSA